MHKINKKHIKKYINIYIDFSNIYIVSSWYKKYHVLSFEGQFVVHQLAASRTASTDFTIPGIIEIKLPISERFPYDLFGLMLNDINTPED